MAIGQREEAYERVTATEVASETELANIASQLSDLNNFAVDINMRVMKFNDRVQGCVPREASGSEDANKREDSLLNGITETIECLRHALNELNNEASRLENIG